MKLVISEQQSDAPSLETQGGWLSQSRHSVVDETENFNASSSSNNTSILTPRQGGADVKDLFQSDFPGTGRT